MASITHFSHEHPLVLLKQLQQEEAKKHVCFGCQQPLSHEKIDSDVYGCETCKSFFLHKSCTEFPMEIVHKSHEHHSLFILSQLPAFYGGISCDLCSRSPLKGFFYHCHMCDFDLDIKCALEEKESLVDSKKDLILHHPSHKQHPLTLQPRPTSFQCDACYVKKKDLSYQCTSCHYLIHRRCAMLPSRTTDHPVHVHPLSLSFGLPSQYHNFHYHCGICKKRLLIKSKLWLYYCELCRFFVHIKCMDDLPPQPEVDLKGLNIDDLPRLPSSDISVEVIQCFLLKNHSNGNVKQEISIFSHKHPLKYSNDQQIIEVENEDCEQVLCDGCIEAINSPPYYHCAECRYFLHLPCAELPHELQHPRHPIHPLTLTNQLKLYDHILCNGCNKNSNGFFFHCTGKGCNFDLDVKCAALPVIVKHKSHNHPLFHKSRTDFYYCSGCNYIIWDEKTYGCESCKFYLHQMCLLFPKTRKSKFDSKHLLTLRFPPHSYHPEPFDCYQCQVEIDPNYWLYHCEVCDLSFHPHCIQYTWTYWEYSNSKFGQQLQIISHPHPLKYVFRASVKSPCHSCGHDLLNKEAVECETCNFHLCLRCVRKFDSVDKLEK